MLKVRCGILCSKCGYNVQIEYKFWVKGRCF
jgi:hypothetical protein